MLTANQSLKQKFSDILARFERYSFSEEQLRDREPDLEMAAYDLAACRACTGGMCKTSLNRDCSNPYRHKVQGEPCGDECYKLNVCGWYALDHRACIMYERPSFAVYKCPGHIERKAQLSSVRQSRWYDD